MSRRALTAVIFTTSLASYLLSQDLSKIKIRISNFGQVNPNYYRGAQPKGADYAGLKELGVKTVIDLQEDGKRDEPEAVRRAGMQYFNIPLSSTHPASAGQTELFLNLVNASENWPVYVHCAGGRHRTGEMTAIYRITHDLWNADQAYEEMKKYDYYSFGGHGSLKTYVYDYYKTYLANAAAEPMKIAK